MQCIDLLRRIACEYQLSSRKLRRLRKSTRDDTSSCNVVLRLFLKTSAKDPVVARELYRSSRTFKVADYGNEKSLYQFAFEEVGHYWNELGAALGFEKPELDGIEEYHLNRCLNVKFMAWAMLEKYRAANGRSLSSVESIRKVLRNVKRRRFVKIPQDDRSISDLLPRCVVDDRRFYGRDDELREIAQYLWNGKARTSHVEPINCQKIQIVSGVGGVGKTTLAFKYVHQYVQSYSDGVFYFNTESYSSFLFWLKENIVRSGDLSNKRDVISSMSSASDVLRAFLRYIRNRPRCLLLLDNTDDFGFVNDVLPGAHDACHIIITTRKAQTHDIFYQRNVNSLLLSVLEKQKAVVALLCWAGKSKDSLHALDYNEKKYAEKVAAEPPVDGLPLALSHAGTYIEQHRITFLKYWRKIDAEAKRLEAAALNLDSFLRYFHLSHLKENLRQRNIHNINGFIRLDPRHIVNCRDQVLRAQTAYKEREKHRVSLTWEMDLDDVRDEESQEGYLLLKCCAVVSSRDIPQDVVADAAFQTNPLDKEFKISKAIKILNERSLVQQISSPDNDMIVTFSMHHLIQASMLQRMAENTDDFISVLKSVSKALLKRLPPINELINYLISPIVLSLTPHIYSTVEKMLRMGILDDNTGIYPGLVDYSCQLALLYKHYEDARFLCSLRVDAFEANSTRFSEEEIRLRRRDYYLGLASSQFCLKVLEEVDVNIRRALGGRFPEELTDSDVLFYEEALYLLAQSQELQGLMAYAELILHKLVNVYSLYETPVAAAGTFNVYLRLSRVYSMSERFDDEMRVLQEALSLAKSGLFDPGIGLASCHQCLASCQRVHGLLDDSLENYFEALRIYQEMIPDAHEDIGVLRYEMSVCMIQHGRYSQACDFSREGLSVIRSVCPPEHPRVPQALYWHGRVLHLSGKHKESIEFLRESLSLFEKGPQRVDTLTEKANCLAIFGDALREGKLIYTCSEQRKREIVRYLKKSVALYTELYPDGKYELSLACVLLCEAYISLGKHDDALEMVKIAWDNSKNLPTGNPARMGILIQYVRCLCVKGQFSDSQDLLIRAREDTKHFPPEHESVKRLQLAESFLNAFKTMGIRTPPPSRPDISQIFDEDVD